MVVAGHGVLAWVAREPGVLTGQDDAEYIVLAESLREGEYRDRFRVDEPTHRTYPPVYPAALAVWSIPFGSSFDSLVALNVAVSATTLLLLFFVLGRVAGSALALLTVALVAINPQVIQYAGGIRSEPLFMLLALAALAAVLPADRALAEIRAKQARAAEAGVVPGRSRGPPPPGQAEWIVLGTVAALLAALTRSVGITILAAIVLHWLLQKRWLLIGIPAAFAVGAIGVWLAWTASGGDQFVGSSYVAELRTLWSGTEPTGRLPGRAVRWTLGYLMHGVPWSMAVPAVPGTPIDNIVVMAGLAILGVAGWLVLLRQWRPAALWLVIYAVLLVIWLFRVDRFVVPAVPLLIASVLIGAHALGQRSGRRAAVALPAITAAVLAIGAAIRTPALVVERVRCDRGSEYPDPACMAEDQRTYFDALRWIEANTPADAVFLSAKPGALFLYTGRQSIAFDRTVRAAPESFIAAVQSQGADWILFASLHIHESTRLAPLMKENCARLRLEAAFPPYTWLFHTADGETGDDAACEAVDAHIATNAEDVRRGLY